MLLFDELTKVNTCHIPSGPKGGQFCSSGSAGAVTGIKVKSVKTKAWSSEAQEVKNKPAKLEVGKLGEDIVIGFLKNQGLKDARTLNVKVNNFPIDLVQNHGAIEVKAGLVSNGKSAQQWRATIGQPGPKETAWLKKASPKAKAAWNLKKQQAILDRKQAALESLGQLFGSKKVKAETYTLIINPDTRKADIYRFKGFHLRIAWNSPQAKKAYVGTVSY